MACFFRPASVAVVGASAQRTGASLLANLRRGFAGAIHPVNPNYPELDGLACHPSVADIPGPVDLAILLVPAPAAPGVVEACGRKGVAGVMIQSAGFAETGRRGRELQEACLAAARAHGMRLWGPNCMGLVDLAAGRLFTFMHERITEAAKVVGPVSLVVQSGMLSAGFLLDLMGRRATGVAKVCSIGNRADVDECDVLEELLADPDTGAVGLYLESLARGRRLVELAAASPKPIAAVLGGRSAAGALAARSHTASLAGDARLAASLLQGAGVRLARDFHHLVDLATGLALGGEVRPGARLAVLTFSGGAGILSCDLMESHGLIPASLAEPTLRALRERVFPEWMAPGNPVDLYPAMERLGRVPAFEAAAEICLADPGVDGLLFHYLVGLEDRPIAVERLAGQARAAGKCLAFWCLGQARPVREFSLAAQAARVPVFTSLATAVEALAAAGGHNRRQGARPAPAPPAGPSPAPAPAAGEVWDEHRSKRLLSSYGLPVVEEELAADAEAAAAAAGRLGWPVALKGLAPGEAHKSERGLVRLHLAEPAQVRTAFAELSAALGGAGRILVQRQARPDYELMAGLVRQPGLGPCLMVGRGGVAAELEPDVAFALLPLASGESRGLWRRLRCRPLLEGWRGGPAVDWDALEALSQGLGRLAAERPEVAQVDLNPLAVERGRVVAVDAGVVLAAAEETA
jgi:acetyltransferase